MRPFCEQIRISRVVRGLNEQQVADDVGLSLFRYRALESGRRPGCVAQWVQLAKVLGLDADLLCAQHGSLPPDLADRLTADPALIKRARQAMEESGA